MKIKNLLMGKFLTTLLAFCIFIVALYYAFWMIKNRPSAKKTERPALAPIVETIPLTKGKHQITTKSMGIVVPAKKITLKPQVSGQIVSVSEKFFPGAFFNSGEIIAKIDDRDFRLAEKRAFAAFEKACANLELENAQQKIAKKQYEDFLASGAILESEDFVLRKPQKRLVESEVISAEAALELARLDLERTIIKSPFNCVILATFVNIGEHVTPQKEIAEIVATDKFWVRAAIPKKDLSFVRISNSSSAETATAKIAGIGGELEASLLKILPDLDEDGQMIRAIFEVDDPLGIKHKGSKIFLDQIVELTIFGPELEDCFKIPRVAFQENKIYVLNNKNRLEIIQVDPIWSDRDWVFFKQELGENYRLIISDLPFVVEGMELRDFSADQNNKQ